MPAKSVEIDLIALCESTMSFWQARAKLLIAHTLCWSSVDLRRHRTDGKTITNNRRDLVGSLAISVIKYLRCKTQIHRNRGEHAYIPWEVCKFVEIKLAA